MAVAPGTLVGTGYIEIVPQFVRGFSQQVSRQVTQSVTQAGSSASKQLGQHGQQAGQSFGSRMVASMRQQLSGMSGMVSTMVGGVAIAGMVKFGNDAINAFKGVATESLTLSRVMGTSVSVASQWRGALKLLGMDVGQFQIGLRTFSKQVEGNGAALRKLGIDTRDAGGNVRPMGDIIKDVADEFMTMPDGAQKSALAVQLFGRSGLQMLPFLNRGSAGIQDLQAKAQQMGITLNDNAKGSLINAAMAQREWNLSLEGLKVRIGQELIPALTQFFVLMNTTILPVVSTAIRFFIQYKDILGPLVAVFTGLLLAHRAMALAQTAWTAATTIANGVMMVWRGIVIAATAVQWVWNAALAANPIGLLIIAVAALVAAGIALWRNWDVVARFFSAAWNAIRGAFTTAINAIGSFVTNNWPWILGALGGPVGLAVVAIIKHWDSIRNAFMGVINAIRGFISANWPWIVGALGGPAGLAVVAIVKHWDGIKNAFSAGVSWVSGLVSGAWGAVVSAFGAVWNGVAGAVSAAWSWIVSAINAGVGWVANIGGGVWRATVGGFATAWNAAGSAIGATWSWLVGVWNASLNWIRGATSGAWNAIYATFTGTFNAIAGFVGATWNWIGALWNNSFNWVRGVTTGAWTAIWGTFTSVFTSIANFLSSTWAWIGALWNNSFNWVRGATNAAWQAIWGTFTSFFTSIANFLGATWAWISNLWNNTFNWVRNATNAAWMAIWTTFTSFFTNIANFLAATWRWISDLWNNTFNWIKSITTAAWSAIWGTFTSVFYNIANFLGATWKWISDLWARSFNWISGVTSGAWYAIQNTFFGALNWISNFVGGFWDGLTQGWNSSLNWMRNTASRVWSDITNIFRSGINFVTQDVFNRFIGAVNRVTGLVGIPAIPNIPRLQKGGLLPGYGGGDIVPALLEPGEAVVPKELVPDMAAWAAEMGIPGFSKGGLVDQKGFDFSGGQGPLDFIKRVGSAAIGAIGSAASWIGDQTQRLLRTGAAGALDLLTKPIQLALDAAIGAAPGLLKWPPAVIKKVIQDIIGWVRGKEVAPPGAGGGGPWAGQGMDLVNAARKYIGSPYLLGGDPFSNPFRSDCSGLVVRAMSDIGHPIGARVTGQQVNLGNPVNGLGNSAAGDLLFMNYGYATGLGPGVYGPGHVAINAGNGKMVEDPHTGAFVREVAIRAGIGAIRRLLEVHAVAPAAGGPAPTGSLQQMAQAWLGRYGWAGQWPAFNNIVNRESSWNPEATNPSSGAYGLGQALPASKIDPYGNRHDPNVQLHWMMDYIKERYRDPNSAWAFWQCVTLGTMILTRDGWKRHDEVRVGDETLGYNPATGRNEWTPILAVHHYDSAPVVRMEHRKFAVTVTPNHRWVAQQWNQVWDGTGRPRRTVVTDEMVETQALHSRHAIRLAAEADTGSGPDITVTEAALLGWVMGDGTVVGAGSSAGQLKIYQTKLRYVEELDRLFKDVDHSHYVYDRPARIRSRDGRESPATTEHVYYWRAAAGRELLARSGYDHTNPVPFVLSLSPEQRVAFLDAFWKAEGGWHKDPRGGYTLRRLSQIDGTKQDAAMLAIYLDGYYPRAHRRAASGQRRANASVLLTRPWLGGERLRVEPAGSAPVWCVTTSLGSWTACVDGQVFLTGNSHNWYRNGLDFVPKDNWPAVLHRGERVLTAEENARYGQLPEVHVYIGERELTDLVDVRVDYTQRQMLARSRAGVGRRA